MGVIQIPICRTVKQIRIWRNDAMKKAFHVICCAAGSGMIGFFANQLNTVVGCVFFTLGVALLVGSIILVSKQDKEGK